MPHVPPFRSLLQGRALNDGPTDTHTTLSCRIKRILKPLGNRSLGILRKQSRVSYGFPSPPLTLLFLKPSTPSALRIRNAVVGNIVCALEGCLGMTSGSECGKCERLANVHEIRRRFSDWWRSSIMVKTGISGPRRHLSGIKEFGWCRSSVDSKASHAHSN